MACKPRQAARCLPQGNRRRKLRRGGVLPAGSSASGSRAGCDQVVLAMPESSKAKKRAARNARLAAALRENLKRRKAQARARERAVAHSADPASNRGAVE